MKVICILFLILSSVCFSQVSDFEEKLIEDMCKTFMEDNELQDSLRVEKMYSEHLYPYFATIEENKIDSIGTSIYFRLQKKCPEFMRILDKADPIDEDEGILYENSQNPTISKSELKVFKNSIDFYYKFFKEITKVKIYDGHWVETFEDGTYSKTKMEWLTDYSFKLIFIESNNSMKNSFSKAGEEYYYDVLKKEENYYIIQSLQSHGKYLQFKLYLSE